MTLRLRWTYNGNDLLLRSRYRDEDGPDWQPLTLHGAGHLRLLLGFDSHVTHTLRQMLLGEGRLDLAHLDDRQVLDEVERLVDQGHWQVLESTGLHKPAAMRPAEPPAKVVQPRSAPPAPVASATAESPAQSASSAVATTATLATATAAATAAAAALIAAQEPGHWIEIELVGEDDRPIANEPYEVTLPDQRVISGQLDAAGWARIDRIASAGDCLVSFPRLDEAAWVVHAESPLDAKEQS